MSIHDGFYTNRFAPFPFYKVDQFEKQARFAARVCGLRPGARILDLACGWGRHSLAWVREGYDVTGVDNSADFLDKARALAQEAGLRVRFERLDMRTLDMKEQFDAVLSMSASLAFYDDPTNIDIIRRAAQALVGGGTFFFDQPNVFGLVERLVRNKKAPVTETLADGRTRTGTHSFDARTLIASQRCVVESDGRRDEAGWDIRCYTLPEIRSIYEQVGLTPEGVYGDYEGSDFSLDSARLITVARK